MSNYKTNALIDAALLLKLNLSTYNIDKLTFLTSSSLTPYSTTS